MRKNGNPSRDDLITENHDCCRDITFECHGRLNLAYLFTNFNFLRTSMVFFSLIKLIRQDKSIIDEEIMWSVGI